MITKRISLTLAAIVGAGLALGTGAGAQVIVQTFTIPTGTTVPFSQILTFNKFDSTLGPLTSITLSLNASILANVDIFNGNSSSNGYSNTSATVAESVTGPGASVAAFTVTAGPFSGTAAPGLTVLPNKFASHSATLNVSAVNFGLYSGIGGGTGTLTAGALKPTITGTASGSNIQNVFFGGTATVGQVITLTYTYQNIPEPGTTTFLAAGVLGSLGMVIRRRKTQ